MSRIFFSLLFPILLFSMDPLNYWWIDDTIYLKKDMTAIYKIYYKDKVYKLQFRWTLYKNSGLVMLYNYKGFPYQNILYKEFQLNGFKKFIADNDSPQAPYFLLYFKNFSETIAEFEFLIYNPKMNIKIKLNEPRYRDREWVKRI